MSGLASELTALSDALRETDPDARGPRQVTVESASRFTLPQFGREDLARFISLLGAVVGFTLLIACANVANLLLARGTVRQREVGIRKAVGASRGRMIRQFTVESLVLSLLGGIAGFLVAAGVVRVLSTATLPGGVHLAELGVGFNGKVLGFSFGLSLLTGLIFGLLPAFRAGAEGLNATLKGGSRSRRGHRLRKSLISVQVGLCLALVVGSVLFVQTLRNGLTLDMGFEPERLVATRFSLASLGYAEEEGLVALDEMVAAIREIPGVGFASYLSRIPLQTGGVMGVLAAVEGYEPAPDEEIRVEVVMAGSQALATLGIPVLEGSGVGQGRDVPELWINQLMADRYFRGGSPVGREIVLSGEAFRVAGVTPDVDWDEVGEENINNAFFTPGVADVVSRSPVTVVARVEADPATTLSRMQDEIRRVAPGVAFVFAQTSRDLVGTALATQRFGAALLTAFGVLALTLAAIGIAGVVAYLVNQRRRDIGLRIALGASRSRILRELLSEMSLPVLAGTVGGLAVSVILGGSVEAFLVDASSRDPVPYAVSAGILLAMALVAVVLPARTTARLQPMEFLRKD